MERWGYKRWGKKKTGKAIKGGKERTAKSWPSGKTGTIAEKQKARQRDEGSLRRGRQLENWRSCTLIANVL